VAAVDLIPSWGVPHAAAVVVDAGGSRVAWGELDRTFRIASVAKLLSAYAGLVALEEGTLHLDEPLDRHGATVRHLLAHAGGYPFDGAEPIAPPGRTRIYSNTGIERFADHLAATAGMPFADYLRDGVLRPLGMHATDLRGSPAHGVWSTVTDLARFATELLAPTLVTGDTVRLATSVQFPGLAGVLPGVGRMDPCDWGLGFEVKGGKTPHWTGTRNSPASFGHFGGAGTFLWVDPVAGAACVVLTDREYGPWALAAWPPFSDAVLEELAA
jgi:CubicO group peptidase (beta-lactamase class C family)